MKKKILAAALAAATVLSFAGCKEETGGNSGAGNSNSGSGNASSGDEGKVLNIACWNYEMAEWFDAYYMDKIPSDVTVNWVQFPNSDGVYQQNLDRLLSENEDASDDEKIDIFLAEADYIQKYKESDVSLALTGIDTSNTYKYVIDAGTDSSGTLKAVSPQATPSGMIVRKSIAKEVLGTDDPDEIQSKLDSWDKFNAAAKDAKAKGYLMTGSITTLWRVYAAGQTEPWLDSNNNFKPVPEFYKWYEQAKDFMANGYSIADGNWGDEVTNNMTKDGKCLSYIGPMWYYAFNMTKAFANGDNGSSGDWCFIEGPQAHYWGGTWLLAAKGGDNPTLVNQIMNDMLNNEDFLNKAADGHGLKERSTTDGSITSADKYNPLFPSNKKVADALAADSSKGFDGFDGQNDYAIQAKIADGITWAPNAHTAFDQTFNEGLFDSMILQWKAGEDGKTKTEEQCWADFYEKLNKVNPTATHNF